MSNAALLFAAGYALVLLAGTLLIYKSRPWRLMEFMFLLVVGTTPFSIAASNTLKESTFQVQDLAAATVGGAGILLLVFLGGFHALNWIEDLRLENTFRRLVVIVVGVVLVFSVPVSLLCGLILLIELTEPVITMAHVLLNVGIIVICILSWIVRAAILKAIAAGRTAQY